MIQRVQVPPGASKVISGVRGWVPAAYPGAAATYQIDNGFAFAQTLARFALSENDPPIPSVIFTADPLTTLDIFIAKAIKDVPELPQPPQFFGSAAAQYLYSATSGTNAALDTGPIATLGAAGLLVIAQSIGSATYSPPSGFITAYVVLADGSSFDVAQNSTPINNGSSYSTWWGRAQVASPFGGGWAVPATGASSNIGISVPKEVRFLFPAGGANTKIRLDVLGAF